MKKTFCIYILLMLTVLCGCTQNEGPIGDIFGLWNLDEMYIDGESADIDCSKYIWKFQKDIVIIATDDGSYRYINSLGTWHKSGDRLYLNFTYDYDGAPEGGQLYNPPAELGIPGREVSELDIVKLTGKFMIVRYISPDGRRYLYSLSKSI